MHLTRSRIQFAQTRTRRNRRTHAQTSTDTRKSLPEAAKALRFAKFAACLHSETLTTHMKHILYKDIIL